MTMYKIGEELFNPNTGVAIGRIINVHLPYITIQKNDGYRYVISNTDLKNLLAPNKINKEFESLKERVASLKQEIKKKMFIAYDWSELSEESENPKVCRRCNGIAKESKALINKPENAEDFGNDEGKSGTTNTLSKDVALVNCWKCSECGHSFN